MDIEKVRSRFIKHFDGKTGNIYMSPGRINLIGEHTDYNGGFVFPGAVDKGIMAEIRPNGTETVMLYSIDLKDRVEFKVNDPEGPRASWARYIYGICQEMKALGVDVKGFNAAFYGDVPLGAGMSSSAALESCFAFALNDLFGDNKVSKWDLVLAGQATEHKYVGVNCGIMDQFASVFGKETATAVSLSTSHSSLRVTSSAWLTLRLSTSWLVLHTTTAATLARTWLSTSLPSTQRVSSRLSAIAHGSSWKRFALR